MVSSLCSPDPALCLAAVAGLHCHHTTAQTNHRPCSQSLLLLLLPFNETDCSLSRKALIDGNSTHWRQPILFFLSCTPEVGSFGLEWKLCIATKPPNWYALYPRIVLSLSCFVVTCGDLSAVSPWRSLCGSDALFFLAAAQLTMHKCLSPPFNKPQIVLTRVAEPVCHLCPHRLLQVHCPNQMLPSWKEHAGVFAAKIACSFLVLKATPIVFKFNICNYKIFKRYVHFWSVYLANLNFKLKWEIDKLIF